MCRAMMLLLPVRVIFILVLALGACAVAPPPLEAQNNVQISVGYEYRADQFTYRFENPSSFDRGLVPHFFRQHYDSDSPWVLFRAAYRPEARRWTTELGITPEVVTYGDDYDTFYQPDGDVVTSGTRGNVSLRSWRVDHQMTAYTAKRLRVHVGYGYRRDRARFHDGYKTVVHTRPPSLGESVVTTRETTMSDAHEVRVGIDGGMKPRGWRLAWNVEVSPITAARLTVLLPDKYPGRTIRFSAPGFGAAAGVGAGRVVNGLLLSLEVGASRTWSYRSDASLRREAITVAASVGWPGR